MSVGRRKGETEFFRYRFIVAGCLERGLGGKSDIHIYGLEIRTGCSFEAEEEVYDMVDFYGV